MPTIEPIEVTSPDPGLLQEIGRLRVRAWATEVLEAAKMDVWLDDIDPTARHWIVTVDGQLAAAARMSFHQALSDVPDAGVYQGVFRRDLRGPIASINRLVVSPRFRRRGLARVLDSVRTAEAQKLQCRLVIGICRTASRVEQLKRVGFKVTGVRRYGCVPSSRLFRNYRFDGIVVSLLGEQLIT